MKPGSEADYYAKIKSLLSPQMFLYVKNTVRQSTNEQLEAFWNMIVAGYPVDFTIDNYRNLHQFLKNKAMDYDRALDTWTSYPGLVSDIQLVKTKWFELN